MNIEELALDLINSTNDCILSTISPNGYPTTAAMIKVKNIGLNKIILSTNLATEKVDNIKQNNKVSIYFYDLLTYKGCLLRGIATIEENNLPLDVAPDGVSKNNLCIINIAVTDGNYYANNTKTEFNLNSM